MDIGSLRMRCRFETLQETPDGQGGFERAWVKLDEVWGRYAPERGREQVSQGRIQASAMALLTIRWARHIAYAVTESTRVIVDDVPHNIRSIANPDQRRKALEIVVERGVAPHA